MSIAVSLTFAALSLIAAASVYRVAAWSIDSPVLRRAVRSRAAAKSLGLVLGLTGVLTVAALWFLGVRQVNGASLFFGGMIFLFGGAGMLFLDLLIEDLREIFAALATRLQNQNPFDGWPEETFRAQKAQEPQPDESLRLARPCADQPRCAATPRPCDSGILRRAWRQSDWQRIHLRR